MARLLPSALALALLAACAPSAPLPAPSSAPTPAAASPASPASSTPATASTSPTPDAPPPRDVLLRPEDWTEEIVATGLTAYLSLALRGDHLVAASDRAVASRRGGTWKFGPPLVAERTGASSAANTTITALALDAAQRPHLVLFEASAEVAPAKLQARHLAARLTPDGKLEQPTQIPCDLMAQHYRITVGDDGILRILTTCGNEAVVLARKATGFETELRLERFAAGRPTASEHGWAFTASAHLGATPPEGQHQILWSRAGTVAKATLPPRRNHFGVPGLSRRGTVALVLQDHDEHFFWAVHDGTAWHEEPLPSACTAAGIVHWSLDRAVVLCLPAGNEHNTYLLLRGKDGWSRSTFIAPGARQIDDFLIDPKGRLHVSYRLGLGTTTRAIYATAPLSFGE
ncbi:hypothetical protein [Chondromyces apiculatus]|uniref:hypothetical protein n=1 Tax=Chondromyces apiculatus TaxID=51 RepID=UPI0018CC5B5C|nr:hypothetical protein [Chondromyces apiculatus]